MTPGKLCNDISCVLLSRIIDYWFILDIRLLFAIVNMISEMLHMIIVIIMRFSKCPRLILEWLT